MLTDSLCGDDQPKRGWAGITGRGEVTGGGWQRREERQERRERERQEEKQERWRRGCEGQERDWVSQVDFVDSDEVNSNIFIERGSIGYRGPFVMSG